MSVKNPDPTDISVGQNVRLARAAKGLSQTALANAIGVTFQQVQKYERGKNRVSAGRLMKIAELLQVPATQLLGTDAGGLPVKHVDNPAISLGLTLRGVRLSRAFLMIDDPVVAEAVVTLVESVGKRIDV